ncbi:anaerobic sulfatase maturase [Corynebacterium pygosceleis]|uniref:anaerobic sulfatase maturase n=1 Tax=Corynebacterium pygosceleis TaxID=2800406 RepID=UPI0019071024|nr:anaerobic sulfatase maturase [Corynebacterium pygosceleis]MCK7674731.1 anaerobic sulfatase maturase [Corynebacterium pygosceleis]MCL0119680.1 anaerobic sulfatase maturase [Corynebacterium pygosceleis]
MSTDDTRPLVRRQLPFSVVAKPTGAACNLDCSYCFFLSKELLYDAKRQQMPADGLETYVSEYLAAQPDGEVTMLWQGGEPTMRGLDFFREAVRLCAGYARPGQIVTHALQTNATLIDEEWAGFLAEQDFLVGVSVDGPEELHDAYRVNKAGRGTHRQVIRGYGFLRDAGVRTNILCTVHHANQDHPERVYTYFRDELGATFMQFIPIVERVERVDLPIAEAGWRTDRGERLLYQQNGDAVTSRTVDPAAYGRFLSKIFDIWRSRDVGQVFVQDFDAALSALFGIHSVCVHAPECGNNFAMEFNGDVYACDHWVEPDWLLGNVSENSFAELARTPRMRSFALKKSAQLTAQCRRCPVLRFCNGGCPKDRFVESSDGEPGQNFLCAGYYHFYSHIRGDLVAMARLVRSGRSADAIMDDQVRNSLRPTVRS